MPTERLQKVLASAGVASRRDCEALITAGRVRVNGHIIRELGTCVDPQQDLISVNGNPIQHIDRRIYLMLHKPAGIVSTVDDPQGRPTVIEIVNIPQRIFPVGRLDAQSEGLLLLTNDGALTHRLTHPKFHIEKEYHVLLDRTPDNKALRMWREGVMLDGSRTAPAWVELKQPTKQGTWVRIVMHEGRKRQIREVAKLLGYTTQRLIRVREGTLTLGDLPSGQWRMLTRQEVQELHQHSTQ